MTTLSIFEKASRNKLRFRIPQGHGRVQGSVEDLWDVPVPSLKFMAEELYKALRSSQDTLFGTIKSDPSKELALEILKRIISVKEEEKQAILFERELQETKRELQEAIYEKQTEAKKSRPLEELQAELDALEAKSK